MTALRIRPVKHGKSGDSNRYCGPSALSAVTGMTTGEAARVIRHITGKPSVTGVGDSTLRRAMLMCGIRTDPLHVPSIRVPDKKWSSGFRREQPTLAAWLRDNAKLRSAGRVFLISAGHHWQLVSGRRFVCGIVGDVVPLTHDGVKRRAKVRAVYELTLTGSAVVKPACAKAPKPAPKPKPKPAVKKRKAKAKVKRAPRATALSLLHDLRREVEGYEMPRDLLRKIDGFLGRRGLKV